MTDDLELPEPTPVDERRRVTLQLAAALILGRGDAHTPLERQWARQVYDLTVALGEARQAGAPSDEATDGA